MTAQPDPYSRFYWRFIDEFPSIYDDKATFGWWMTLLVIAEGAHPSPAFLPHGVPTKALTKLVDAELVVLGVGGRYRIKGVTKERERRAEPGRAGARGRWSQSERSDNAMRTHNERLATAMPDETRRDETSKDETRRAENGLAPIDENDLENLRQIIAATTEPALRERYTALLRRKEAEHVH